MKKLSKKKNKFKKNKNYLNSWDNSFFNNNKKHNYMYECTSEEVNKIAIDVFGALCVSASDLI